MGRKSASHRPERRPAQKENRRGVVRPGRRSRCRRASWRRWRSSLR